MHRGGPRIFIGEGLKVLRASFCLGTLFLEGAVMGKKTHFLCQKGAFAGGEAPI